MDSSNAKKVEEMLRDWHFWSDKWRPKLDAPPVSLFGHLQKTSELYDEEEIEHRYYISMCEIIDTEVNNLPLECQHCIDVVTKNKVAGISVWKNIRYSQEQVKKYYFQGLELLIDALKSRGLI